MTSRRIQLAVLTLSAVLASGAAFTSPEPLPATEQAALYKQGTESLDAEKWDKALAAFSQASRLEGDRTDGALYWKAYAENRLGRKADARATLKELSRRFPKSRWAQDGSALELEMGGGDERAAVAAAEGTDDELKLIALSGIMSSDPARALPLVTKVLSGKGSRDLRERALFVLAQSGLPEARAIVADVARGKREPDLQERALQHLGVVGGPESRRILDEVFATGNESVREHILGSYMVVGDRARLLAVARTDKSPELRERAVGLLGAMKATEELVTLLGEASPQTKEAIVSAFAVAGDADRLLSIGKTDPSREVRVHAIKMLGIVRHERVLPALLAIYRDDRDPDVKDAVVDALFIQGNAATLVSLARAEKDRERRTGIVQKLSTMHAKEATEYLLEILEK